MSKMKKTNIKEQEVFFKVVESSRVSRKSIEHRHGVFKIKHPEGSQIFPVRFLEQNSDWVLKYADNKKLPERSFKEGEQFSILGDLKKVKVKSRKGNTVDEDILLAEHLIRQTSLKDQLEKTLREHSRDIFHEKADIYSQFLDEDYNRIFVRDQKTRWGSCSEKNNLNFNWRLILGPEHVLDYIVAHEVAHLKVKNHSKDFWNLLEEIRPDYSESQKWLNENSAELVFDPEDI